MSEIVIWWHLGQVWLSFFLDPVSPPFSVSVTCLEFEPLSHLGQDPPVLAFRGQSGTLWLFSTRPRREWGTCMFPLWPAGWVPQFLLQAGPKVRVTEWWVAVECLIVILGSSCTLQSSPGRTQVELTFSFPLFSWEPGSGGERGRDYRLTANLNRREVQLASSSTSIYYFILKPKTTKIRLSGYSSHSSDFLKQLTSFFFLSDNGTCDSLNFASILHSTMDVPHNILLSQNSCSSKIALIPSTLAHWTSCFVVCVCALWPLQFIWLTVNSVKPCEMLG